MAGTIDELAIFGGRPAFAEPLHVGRPNIGDRDRLLERINDILDRRWLTNDGTYVQQFEKKIAEATGAKHAVAMCNATIALELTLEALGISGEVILPSFTFIATAHAVMRRGATPVFCDIDPDTHNLLPAAVEAAVTDRTSAILAVHLWGQPCDVDALADIAARHSLRLLFDSAHALHSVHGGRPVGAFGNAEIFSFHATKFVNSFEGGAVTTDDDALAERLKLIRNFGFVDYDRVAALGTNAKLPEVSAAMGITSMESAEEFVRVNERNHRLYESELHDVATVRFVTGHRAEPYNFQYVVIEWDEKQSALPRDEVLAVLRAENIFARRYFYPGCHRMEPYRSLDLPRHSLEVTDRVATRVISLPSGTAVDASAIRSIAAVLRTCAHEGGAIAQRRSARASDVLV